MPHRPQQSLYVFVLFFLIVPLSGCASPSGGSSVLQITPSAVLISSGQSAKFDVISEIPAGAQFLWQVNGVVGGSSSTGTITTSGVYTAPVVLPAQPVQVGIRGQVSSAMVTMFDPKQPIQSSVTTTQNPLVAAYSVPVPVGGSASVQFGTDASYGLSTSNVPAPATGGSTTVLVAGMRASTTYHMQATIHLPDGSQVRDGDHVFGTGAIPADRLPAITTQLTGSGTPSPGVELLSLVPSSTGNALCAVATDLAGNVIWYYDLPLNAYPFPIKQLLNGDMLLVVDSVTGNVNEIREIDLAGNLIHQVTIDAINSSLAAVSSVQILDLTHEILQLPNGHVILLSDIAQILNNQPGIPAGTVVSGNALVDWDYKTGAMWVWSTFDHIPLTHAPNGLADWTHGNAVIYSPDDGDLIFSMRNQNWVVKINYQNGAGDGSILWRLGPDGDFSLPAQDAPVEWNYGQHFPTVQSSNSSGVFSLMVFNNGNNRLVDSNNDVCGSPGVPSCYSSVPIFELNEYTKTVTVLWQNNLSPAYSICCGDALTLPNGNVEFDVALDQNSPGISYIEEMTQTQAPQLVWRMNIQGQLAYRGIRIPSLYPGQVWAADALQGARTPANSTVPQTAPER
jgi:arylsulfate sulfotransferase